jgi:subtilisin family serine protease
MSIAGAGLLPNPPGEVGVSIAANTTAINQYTNLSIIGQSITVINSAVVQRVANNISSATLTGITSLGNSTFPALTNVPSAGNVVANLLVGGTPSAVSSVVYTVSDAINYDVLQIVGGDDASKFCQTFQSAQGYLGQANALLNSVKNADILAQTFDPATGGMNTLSTGGLNQVSGNLSALGTDLTELGQLINLQHLDDLGLPGELLAQIGRVTNGGIPAVTELLQAVKIPDEKITSLGRGTNTLTSQEEKSAYTVMVSITGVLLSQVTAILGVQVSNITNMAQLLNPKLILPTSYLSLLCPTTDKLSPIYLANGSVNYDLEPVLNNVGVTAYSGPNNTNSLATLKLIIPPDQALANKALARGLQQVKNITNTTLAALASALVVVRSIDSLPAVANLTTPVPSSVKSFYQSQLGVGSGPNGTILLVDVIGAGSGYIIAGNLDTVSNSISNLQTAGSLTTLSACYNNMLGTLGNVFGNAYAGPGNVIIPSGPGAGAYDSWDDAFATGLLPAANAAISTIVASNSTQVNLANSAWGNIILSLSNQHINQVSAELDFANLQPNSKSSTMSFASSLHEYGLDESEGGASQYITAVADSTTLGGQSILASLQEGRNLASLNDAGMQLDTQLSDAPSPGEAVTPAPLVGWSEYSANWSKGATLIAADRNWGLLRSYLGTNISNWGFDGTADQEGTVAVKASGKNVDVVIVDAVIDPDHPEFAVNSDGSGGSRFQYINWYGLPVSGNPAAGQTYNPPITTTAPNSADDSRHATFVAGVAAGNTQGWAPGANIYNISPQYVTGGVQYTYLYKYILAFHLAKRAAGNTNPTICNNSWSSRYTIPYTSITSVTWRGVTFAGPFSLATLLDYGITNDGTGNCVVNLQNSTMEADIQACINAGIIMVASAGNNDTRMSVPGDVDYNNTLTATGFNSGSPIYYARPSAPVSSNVICVGSIGAGITSGGDRKASVSNCGPRVNLFAPGSFITSSWLTSTTPTGGGYPAPVQDPRDTVYWIAKYSGTSFSSPQVTGILACVLEKNPTFNQTSALNYIVNNALIGQIPDSGGSYADSFSLQGAPNRYLTLPVEFRD